VAAVTGGREPVVGEAPRARTSRRGVVVSNLRIGIEALGIHPLRTMLSVLGILIGSAALVATMAVSDGILHLAREEIRRETSVQVIAISPRMSVYEDEQWVPVHDYPRFRPADAAALRAQLPGVDAVTLVLGGRTTARYRGAPCRVAVTLGTAALPDFGKLEMGAGRFFTDIEVDRNAPVVVINHALASALATGRDPFGMLGRDIHVHDQLRRVVGILAAGPFDDADNPSFAVLAPIGAARALIEPPPDGRFAPTIQLMAPSLASVHDVRDAASDWLSRRYPGWQRRVQVHLALEQIQQVEQAVLLMKLFMGALVGISLLVGGVGIMNVLLASVVERTREIGIRKSVGARRDDIRMQFLAESVAIALAGAGLGLLLGFLLAVGVTALFRHFVNAPVHPALSPGSVLIATLSSSVVGLVFGTLPANRASRLPPVVAMAQE
jgi:putative ABC transport system permease protein